MGSWHPFVYQISSGKKALKPSNLQKNLIFKKIKAMASRGKKSSLSDPKIAPFITFVCKGVDNH
jgi:hypothetical protein